MKFFVQPTNNPNFSLRKGTSQSSSTEIKRNSAVTPKKEDLSSASLAGKRSVSNSRNSNNAEDEDPRPGDRSMFMRRQK